MLVMIAHRLPRARSVGKGERMSSSLPCALHGQTPTMLRPRCSGYGADPSQPSYGALIEDSSSGQRASELQRVVKRADADELLRGDAPAVGIDRRVVVGVGSTQQIVEGRLAGRPWPAPSSRAEAPCAGRAETRMESGWRSWCRSRRGSRRHPPRCSGTPRRARFAARRQLALQVRREASCPMPRYRHAAWQDHSPPSPDSAAAAVRTRRLLSGPSQRSEYSTVRTSVDCELCFAPSALPR